MRQAGVLAAACLYALDHHRDRLNEDHAHAQRLAEGLAAIPGLSIAMPVATNMVFFDLAETLPAAQAFSERLEARGVRMLSTAPRRIRAVCHLDVSRSQIDEAIRIVGEAARMAR